MHNYNELSIESLLAYVILFSSIVGGAEYLLVGRRLYCTRECTLRSEESRCAIIHCESGWCFCFFSQSPTNTHPSTITTTPARVSFYIIYIREKWLSRRPSKEIFISSYELVQEDQLILVFLFVVPAVLVVLIEVLAHVMMRVNDTKVFTCWRSNLLYSQYIFFLWEVILSYIY